MVGMVLMSFLRSLVADWRETGAPVSLLADVVPGTDDQALSGGENRDNKSDFSLERECKHSHDVGRIFH